MFLKILKILDTVKADKWNENPHNDLRKIVNEYIEKEDFDEKTADEWKKHEIFNFV